MIKKFEAKARKKSMFNSLENCGASYTICESCRIDVHVEDVVSIINTGELFCFICKDEYEYETKKELDEYERKD